MGSILPSLLPIVLIIEDDKWQQGMYEKALRGKAEVMQALTIEDAEKLFLANTELAAIIVDACVPGDELNTGNLVAKFRRTFTGPIIAASNQSRFRGVLIDYGCSHTAEKPMVAEMLLGILGIN